MTALVYHAPTTVEAALDLLHRLGPRALVLAGGQDIVPMMNQGQLHPGGLIDVKALKTLAGLRVRGDTVVIGALTTHRTIEREGTGRGGGGLLADAARQIGGGIQVRNRGTIGGSVCAGHPAYDYGAPLVALGAEFRVASLSGERRIPASAFFANAHVTAVRPDELLLEIALPSLGSPHGVAYEKLKFTDGCYAIASAASTVQLNTDGTYAAVRLAVGGVAAVPIRAHEAEAELVGARPGEDAWAAASALAVRAVEQPRSDVLADGEYRRAMAGIMVRRALARATARARGRAPEAGSP